MSIKKRYKMFLFTYYFGYFKLKWRRLIRTILLFAFIYFSLPAFEFIDRWTNYNFSNEIILFVLVPSTHFIIFGLISWILEPFVITKKIVYSFNHKNKNLKIKNI